MFEGHGTNWYVFEDVTRAFIDNVFLAEVVCLKQRPVTRCLQRFISEMSMFGSWHWLKKAPISTVFEKITHVHFTMDFDHFDGTPRIFVVSVSGRHFTSHTSNTDMVRVRGRTKKRGSTTLDCAFDASKVRFVGLRFRLMCIRWTDSWKQETLCAICNVYIYTY